MKRYLALGDSYTIGEAVRESERWPMQLVSRLRAHGIAISDPEIIAVTGWTTGELTAGMDAADPQGPFELVSLLIGVNNQYRGLAIDAYRRELAALLARAAGLAGRGASSVIFVSVPDWSVTPFAKGRDRREIAAAIDRFNAVGQEKAAAVGARFLDITPVSRRAAQDPALLAEDGLHPSGRMYAEWAELALPHALAALGAADHL